MPILFYMKYKTGKSLNSKSLIADSKQTLACMYLSIALLIGLLLNYIYEIWQADPIVGIIIAIYLLKEGYEILLEIMDRSNSVLMFLFRFLDTCKIPGNLIYYFHHVLVFQPWCDFWFNRNFYVTSPHITGVAISYLFLVILVQS